MRETPTFDELTSYGKEHVTAATWVGAIATIGGAFVGGILYGNHEAYLNAGVQHVRNMTHIEDVIDSDQAGLNQAQYSLKQKPLVMSMGEGCVTLINPYRIGGLLADTPETDAVDDILKNPSQACGSDPTTIRSDLRSMRGADDAVAVQQDALDKAQAKKQEYLSNKNVLLTSNRSSGGVRGIGLGIVASFPFGFLTRRLAIRRQAKKGYTKY